MNEKVSPLTRISNKAYDEIPNIIITIKPQTGKGYQLNVCCAFRGLVQAITELYVSKLLQYPHFESVKSVIILDGINANYLVVSLE